MQRQRLSPSEQLHPLFHCRVQCLYNPGETGTSIHQAVFRVPGFCCGSSISTAHGTNAPGDFHLQDVGRMHGCGKLPTDQWSWRYQLKSQIVLKIPPLIKFPEVDVRTVV